MAVQALAQATYQPKFKNHPARSDSEAAALGYLRTFLRAQKIYKKKNDHFATSLMDLAKTGSFTRRMASAQRGDYTVKFTPHKDKDTFEIVMAPRQTDTTHRSFFAKMEGTNRRDDGVIRADDQKEADEHSPVLKPDAVPGNTPSLSIVKQRPGRPVAPTLRRQLKRSHASARRAWTNLRCFAVAKVDRDRLSPIRIIQRLVR